MIPKIVIDPGHGGRDRANRGPTGYVEADGVLVMALALKETLEQYECDVVLTRTEDEYVSLKGRGLIAVGNEAFIFMSLHTNAGGGTGPEVYYSVDIPADRKIAAKLSKAIADEFDLKDRGPKVRESKNYPGEDYFTVIDFPQDNGVPHIFLLEPMFHDDPEEEAMLKQPETMRRIARVVTEVLVNEFNLVKKGLPTGPIDNIEEAMTAWYEEKVLPVIKEMQEEIAILKKDKQEIAKVLGGQNAKNN